MIIKVSIYVELEVSGPSTIPVFSSYFQRKFSETLRKKSFTKDLERYNFVECDGEVVEDFKVLTVEEALESLRVKK